MNTGRTVLIAVVRRWWVRGFGRCARGLPLKSHRRVGSNRILDHPGLRRSGDHLYLTAPLGRAARPWLALAKGRRSAREVWVEVRTRHRQPQQALPSSITFATSTSPRSNTACWRMRSISPHDGQRPRSATKRWNGHRTCPKCLDKEVPNSFSAISSAHRDRSVRAARE
jgi:hypothetical protein